MVIMIDITVEYRSLYKVLTFNSLYAIIAFDYFAGWAATTFVRPHLLLPEG
jgi:hypothetical protein